MKSRMLIAVALSFLTVMGLQFFTNKKKNQGQPGVAGQVQSGQFYAAKAQQVWPEELNREIDFVDGTLPKEEIVNVENENYQASFSNIGGVLTSLTFKKHKGEKDSFLQTIYKQSDAFKEEGCFLLALEEKSPASYSMIDRTENEAGTQITYQAEIDKWVVQKIYFIHNNSYKIDIIFNFNPRSKDAKDLTPRIFFPAPLLHDFKDDAFNGFLTTNGKTVEKIPSNKELNGVWGMPEIFGLEDKYFAHSLIKDEDHFVRGGYYKRVNNKLFAILLGNDIKKKGSWKLSFYMGPKLVNELSAVDDRLDGVLSFGWFSWISKMLLKLLAYLYKYLNNYGLAIIVLTILLKLPFVPLSIVSRKKMEDYQKFQPTIARIRQKYKSDPARQQQELVQFHKDHNISPATSMVGCLPMLIQFPFLIALYRALGNYLDLYKAPFFGWITDLSLKDPYYVLPILMGAAMLWQQSMTPATDSKMKVAGMFMPILMVAIFIKFPAGLVLYWFTNNLLTIGEDLLRKRIYRKA